MHRFLLIFTIGVFGFVSGGCSKPTPKNPNASEIQEALPEEKKPSLPPKPAPAPISEAVPAPEPPPEPEATEPKLPYGSVDPILEVRETGKKIVLSGHLSSRLQEKDIVDFLSESFASSEVTSELDVGDHVKPVQGWGNRVTGLLIPLIESADEARFHYQDGVVTLEGAVPDQGTISKLQRLTIEVMEGPDSQGIENKLKVAE